MKKRVTSYTFDKTAKTVTSSDFSELEAIQLITNVTSNVIIYQFNNPSLGGSLASTTLTLDYDTSAMADSDKLMILLDDGVTTQTVSGTVASGASDSGNPVKVGGKYNSSLPTYTDGQRGDLQIDSRGNLRTSLVSSNGATAAGIQTPADGTALGTSLRTNSMLALYNGTTTDMLRGNSTDGALVNLGANNDVTVTGSVTANAGTNLNTSSLATSTNITGGGQKSQIVDGSGNVIGATSNALDVNIKSGASSGTQYTEADTDASITGTAMMWEDTSDTLRAVSATKPLPVDITDSTIAATQSGTWNVTNVSGTVSLPTGASTLAEQQSQTTHLSNIATSASTLDDAIVADDAVFTPATTKVMMSGFEFDDTSPDTVNEGDAGAARMSANRSQYTQIRDAAGNERGVNVTASNALSVDSSATTQPVSAASLPLPSGAATSANQTTIIGHVDGIETLIGTTNTNTDTTATNTTAISSGTGATTDAAATAGSTGSVNAKLRLTTSQLDSIKTSVETLDNAISGSEMQVDVVGALPAGTNAIGKLSANSGVDIGDVDVTTVTPGTSAANLGKAEDSGHSSTDTGVFALAVRQDTPNTATTSANADYSQVSVSSTGALRSAPMSEDFAGLANGPQTKKYYTNAGAVTDGIIWSPAAGKRWYITDIFISVSAATTITLEDGKTAGDEAVWKAELAANSGWSHSFNTPLFSGEDAADLLVTTTAGNVYITTTGYEI